jgi:hypothetical protein
MTQEDAFSWCIVVVVWLSGARRSAAISPPPIIKHFSNLTTALPLLITAYSDPADLSE